MSESKDTRALCRMLERNHACQTYPLIGSEMTPDGWPDRLIVSDRIAVLVEFKSFDGYVRPKQVERARLIDTLGTIPVVGCCISAQDPRGVSFFDMLGRVECTGWHKWSEFLLKCEQFCGVIRSIKK